MNVKRGMGSTTRTFSCRYTAIREDKKTYFWDDIVGGHHTLFSIVLSALLAILATQRSLSDLFFYHACQFFYVAGPVAGIPVLAVRPDVCQF